jgi:hypothetical protein
MYSGDGVTSSPYADFAVERHIPKKLSPHSGPGIDHRGAASGIF